SAAVVSAYFLRTSVGISFQSAGTQMAKPSFGWSKAVRFAGAASAGPANGANRTSEQQVRRMDLIFKNRLRHHRLWVFRNVLQHLRHNVVGGDTFGFGFKIQNEAVAQGGRRRGLNVFKADIEPALSERAHFAGQDKALGAARAAAETQVLIGDG